MNRRPPKSTLFPYPPLFRSLMARDNILHKVRTALGRSAGQAVAPVPPVRLRVPEVPMEPRIASFIARLEVLAGKAVRDRKSTRLNSSHLVKSHAAFCLPKKT